MGRLTPSSWAPFPDFDSLQLSSAGSHCWICKLAWLWLNAHTGSPLLAQRRHTCGWHGNLTHPTAPLCSIGASLEAIGDPSSWRLPPPPCLQSAPSAGSPTTLFVAPLPHMDVAT